MINNIYISYRGKMYTERTRTQLDEGTIRSFMSTANIRRTYDLYGTLYSLTKHEDEWVLVNEIKKTVIRLKIVK